MTTSVRATLYGLLTLLIDCSAETPALDHPRAEGAPCHERVCTHAEAIVRAGWTDAEPSAAALVHGWLHAAIADREFTPSLYTPASFVATPKLEYELMALSGTFEKDMARRALNSRLEIDHPNAAVRANFTLSGTAEGGLDLVPDVAL